MLGIYAFEVLLKWGYVCLKWNEKGFENLELISFSLDLEFYLSDSVTWMKFYFRGPAEAERFPGELVTHRIHLQ